MKKTFNIVMLPTEKANPNLFIHQGLGCATKTLASGQGIIHHEEMMKCGVSKPQHLHIISEDKIFKGDWFIKPVLDSCFGKEKKYSYQIDQATEDLGYFALGKKIVASTDKQITPNSWIPESFVRDYIKSVNVGKEYYDDNDKSIGFKSKPIEEVDLETITHRVMGGGLLPMGKIGGKGNQPYSNEVVKTNADGSVIIHLIN